MVVNVKDAPERVLTYILGHAVDGKGGKQVVTGFAKLDNAITWDNVATTFTGFKVNVTDTASAVASKLIDLQIGGASKLSLTKAGLLDLATSGGHLRAQQVTLFSGGSLSFNASDAAAPALLYEAAGTLAQRLTTTAQIYRIYNTYTSATNYERLSIGWASNVCTIKTEAQTGTRRPLQIGFTPQTVASLPAATEGAVMFVNDALDPVLGTVVQGGGTVRIPVYGTASSWICGAAGRQKESIPIAVSDETTAITAGTNKIKFRMPYAMTLTSVRASLGTAQATGLIVTVDINEGGVSILSTKLTIDNTETTSVTAAVAAVISDTLLADDAEISIDIDQVGDGTAIGLKVTLIGVRT